MPKLRRRGMPAVLAGELCADAGYYMDVLE
jgi:hypothetical protein